MKKITVLALCAGSWLLPLSSAALAQGRGPMGDGPRGDGAPPGDPRFGGPGRGGPRGGSRGGGMRAMGEKGDLMRVWRGIGRLDDVGTPLSKAQAKRVVTLMLPWSKKPTMTQANAKSLRPKLEAILTAAQQNELGPGPRGFGDGPPFGDGPRRGGPGDGGPDGRGPDGRGPRGDGPAGRRGGPDGDGPPGGGFGPEDGPGGRRGMRGDGPGGRGLRGLQLTEAQRVVVRNWVETSNPFYAPTGNPRWKQLPTAFQQDEARRYKEIRATLEALSRQSR